MMDNCLLHLCDLAPTICTTVFLYLVLVGQEWLEDVVPHAEEHRRVDDMERPGGKCTLFDRGPSSSMVFNRVYTLVVSVKTNLPEPKWKSLLNQVYHDELVFQRDRAELLEPEAPPVKHGGDAGHLSEGFLHDNVNVLYHF